MSEIEEAAKHAADAGAKAFRAALRGSAVTEHDASKLRPQHRTQEMLCADGSAELIAALVRKLGGAVRLRFRELAYKPPLTVWHDTASDELVLLAPSDEEKPRDP